MRITLSLIEAQITRLNELTNSPKEPWTRIENKSKANIGNYHLDSAYGGYELHRMINESGGIQDVLFTGHISKREISSVIDVYIRGVHHTMDENRKTA